MNRQQLTLIVSCALLLSGAGAFAATFTVPAPTANPAADTAAIQSAINSAVASADPTNFVQLQSGATYVLDTTLAIAGSPVNVTFTTTGAQPATLVGAPTPTRTLAANAGQGGDLGTFSVNVRNGRLGWENLILLPAPLSTLGVSSKAGQSAIAAYPGTATTTFTLSNVLITGNNNSNQPVSTDGSIDPTTVPNYTVWGENGVRITSSSAVAGYGGLTSSNVVYMKDAVVSGCKYGFYSEGYVIPGLAPSTCSLVVLEDSVISWSVEDGATFGGVGTVRLINVEVHHSGNIAAGDRGLDVWRAHLLFATGCFVHDNPNYGIVTNFVEQVHLENCLMANNAKYGFGERNAPANVESSTAVVRNCVSINDLFANTSTSTNFISVMRLPFTWVTVEDCIVIGSATTTAGRGPYYGISLFSPLSAVVRNCYVQNVNRAGIILFDGRAPGTLRPQGTDVLVENCVLEDCGTHVNSLMTRPLQTDPDYNGAATFQLFSPLALDQASSVVVRNIAIRRTKAPAVAVSFAGSQYANGTALLENLLLENCAEKLADVRTEQTNSNVITVRNWTAVGDAGTGQINGYGTGVQVRGASVTIEDCTIHNRIEEALRDASSGAASAADVHSFRNLEVRDVGGPAILVANTSRARNVISTCSIRNVTGASGILLSGGQHGALSSVEVINAASWGVSLGDPNSPPQAPISLDGLDDLCLVGNGSGGLRFALGDNTQPPLPLTNSTILDGPVGISYESLSGQVLDVTDCIIAGEGAAGDVGIDVPVQVGFTGAGSPPPRVRVWTSALVQEGPWALSAPTLVVGSNEPGTLTLSGIVTLDPWFKSTDPNSPDFLVVSSEAYQGVATGVGAGQTTNLDGCSRLEGPLSIGEWRLY